MKMLLPCPFCGGQGSTKTMQAGNESLKFVKCLRCGHMTEAHEEVDTTHEKWNRRFCIDAKRRPKVHEVWGIKKDPTTWFYVYRVDEHGYNSFNLLRRKGYHWSSWGGWPTYYDFIGGGYALLEETLFGEAKS